MNHFLKLFVPVLLSFHALACSPDEGGNSGGSDADTDADASSDTDTDTDTDSDSDSDSDSDTNTNNDGQGCTAMDILFVIDDSGSMGEEQDNLVDNFPKFIKVLDDYGTSYRVGVTTTGVNRSYKEKIFGSLSMPMSTTGPTGVLQGKKACGLANPWVDGPGPNVTTEFSCTANVGTVGSATEMPFAALEAALENQSAAGKPNEGFYRKDDGSLLVVVLITDEDDCSIEKGGVMALSSSSGADCSENQSTGLYSPEQMVDFLNGITGGTGRYVVVGIAGIQECSSAFGSAIQAKRVHELVDLCADYGVHGDICGGDLWISLEEALNVMQEACDEMPAPV
jgi:hypothetical protein